MEVVEGVFSIGDVISFSVYPPAILGTGFVNVLVMAVLDAETAKLVGIDPIALHAAIYPDLPDEHKTVYKKHTDYYYIKIKMPNGTITALGLPWIDMATVAVQNNQTGRFTIAVSNGDTDINNILTLLNANGYHNILLERL